MRYINNQFLNKLLENDATKAIFDNIRNFFYCALFLAIGTQAVTSPTSVIGFSKAGIIVSGSILIIIGLCLMALNILDGVHKLSKFNMHATVYPFIVLIYLIVVIRMVGLAWGYRLH